MNALLFLQTPILPRRPFGQPAGVDTGVDPMAYEWLHLGVRSALDGNHEDARYYFVQAVRTDLNFARAWLYLGGVADDPALTLSCVQKVLQIDPGDAQARIGLLWAREKLGLPAVLSVWEPPTSSPPHLKRVGSSAPPAARRLDKESRPGNVPITATPLGVRQPAGRSLIPPLEDVASTRSVPSSAGGWAIPPAAASPVPVPPWADIALPALPSAPPVPVLPPLPPLPPPLHSSAPSAQLAMPLLTATRPGPVHVVDPAPAAPPAIHRPVPAAVPLDDARNGDVDSSSGGLLLLGVQAAAVGNRARARYYFLKAIAADAGNTRAWLYLGGVAGDPSLTLACLERVLRVEPWNREARVGADWAVSRLGLGSPSLLWWR